MLLSLNTKKGNYLPLFQKVGVSLLIVIFSLALSSNQAKTQDSLRRGRKPYVHLLALLLCLNRSLLCLNSL